MKTLSCNRRHRWNTLIWTSVFLAWAWMMCFAGPAVSDDKPLAASGADKESEKIHITSDSLITDNNASYAEFVGNVQAAQGTTLITSDRLRIYYGSSGSSKDKKITSQDSVKKIMAIGNVTIRFDNRVAVTEQAEYTTETGVIVLTGANSRVTSGSNYVSGEKITLYRNQDKVTVERSKEKRVEAVFYPGQTGKQ